MRRLRKKKTGEGGGTPPRGSAAVDRDPEDAAVGSPQDAEIRCPDPSQELSCGLCAADRTLTGAWHCRECEMLFCDECHGRIHLRDRDSIMANHTFERRGAPATEQGAEPAQAKSSALLPSQHEAWPDDVLQPGSMSPDVSTTSGHGDEDAASDEHSRHEVQAGSKGTIAGAEDDGGRGGVGAQPAASSRRLDDQLSELISPRTARRASICNPHLVRATRMLNAS